MKDSTSYNQRHSPASINRHNSQSQPPPVSPKASLKISITHSKEPLARAWHHLPILVLALLFLAWVTFVFHLYLVSQRILVPLLPLFPDKGCLPA